MHLEVSIKVPLPEGLFGSNPDDIVYGIEQEYVSLTGLVADLVEGEPGLAFLAKVVEPEADAWYRVSLAGYERACPDCLRPMQHHEHGPAAWTCECGKQEGHRAGSVRR